MIEVDKRCNYLNLSLITSDGSGYEPNCEEAIQWLYQRGSSDGVRDIHRGDRKNDENDVHNDESGRCWITDPVISLHCGDEQLPFCCFHASRKRYCPPQIPGQRGGRDSSYYRREFEEQQSETLMNLIRGWIEAEDGKTFFIPALVCGDVDFSGLIFPSDIDFTGAVFKGEVNFKDVVFDGDAIFNTTIFQGSANFEHVQFNGNAYFSSGNVKDLPQFFRIQ